MAHQRFFILFLSLAVLLIPHISHALEIKKIRHGEYDEKTRMVLEMNEQSNFRLFVLSDPYRMVVDLPSFKWNADQTASLEKIGIKAIRHGNLKPGISRIVFDLNAPMQIKNAFTLPRHGDVGDRLVIDFAPTDNTGFTHAKKEIFGKLNVEGIQSVSAARPIPAPSQTNNIKPLIIIDPGHGGVDPGAIGANGVHEKNVVLALGKELKRQLENSGHYRVKMTRDSDTFIKLSDRVKFAREQGGDLFVSIHADSVRNPSVNGASFYTLSEKASDAQTAKLAARENKADLIAGVELDVEDEAVMDILIDLARRNTQNQSKFFANTLVEDFKKDDIKTLKSSHRYANFAVLKAPEIPSVLVETGFMSNKTEANKLNTDTHRRKLAASIKKGIDRYFKTVKENERT